MLEPPWHSVHQGAVEVPGRFFAVEDQITDGLACAQVLRVPPPLATKRLVKVVDKEQKSYH
jgi:hypothetical protein